MEFKWSQPPMMPPVAVSYRGLYGEGAFWQRELISSDELAAMAKRRGIPAIASFMKLDENEAFEPIAFVEGHYPLGDVLPTGRNRVTDVPRGASVRGLEHIRVDSVGAPDGE